MHFMLVYPNTSKTRHPQSGLLTLGSYLIEQGVDSSICDLTFTEEERYSQETLGYIQKHKPDIIGVSLRTLEFDQSRKMLQEIRRQHPDILLVAGGPHPTYAPKEVASYVDYGVIGDGEEACLDMARLVAEGRRELIADLPNLFSLQNGELVSNPARPLFNLANSPMPRFELFDERHYTDHCFLRLVPDAKVCGVFEGSRGCPYTCTYCSNSSLMEMSRDAGKWRREKKPQQLRGEIDHFKSLYGLDMIYFVDEVIMTSDGRTQELKENLHSLKTPFVFMERPELIRESRVRDMKEAGAYSCSIGIESGGEEFRKSLLKRNMPDKKIKESYELMHKVGIRTHAFIMMGMPDQDDSVMQESIKLLQEIQPHSAQATTFYPLPATELYNLALERGLFDPTVRPSNYYTLSSLRFSLPHKRKIQMYAQMVNLELWRKTPIRRLTVWLCVRIPALFPLVDRYMNSPTGYVRYRSIRNMTAKQFIAKLWEKIAAPFGMAKH
jgi:anaerobic magnesium-protoporphyrin IX monomethyl ester cyclase